MGKRKYQKVTGYWVYGHITPNGKIYIGCSGKEKCSDRFKSQTYNGGSLQPYIEKYGWNNIKHIVFKDGLTQKQAEQLEDLLITQAKIDGWCINIKNSGGYERDNPKEYYKQYFKQETHRKKVMENSRRYFKTSVGKIYYRVSSFNTCHPERKIITALEAKEMYLLTGYIPDFIKNDDL